MQKYVFPWCTLQVESVYFKSAEKIAHMMTPLKFYHKMENDGYDYDNCNCWKYIHANGSSKWAPENEEKDGRKKYVVCWRSM